MKNTKKSSLTLAALTVLTLSLITSNADAQGWRSAFGWGQQRTCGTTTLRQDVYSVDRLANQMVYQFQREMHCGCREQVKLMSHMKKNAVLTRNLVTAFNGSCKCAFKKAACALNDNTNCLAKQSRRVHNLSCSLKGSVSQTVVLAKRIHRNADQFTPRNSGYTNYNRPAPHAPVHRRPHNHQGPRQQQTSQQEAVAGLIFSLFNR